ncbi:MAG: SpoIID/LytB domain-containing protein [Nitrospirae bacterium]|nr:SpoIID/LytB domain-containing protein [Nitrospirota bacterium]
MGRLIALVVIVAIGCAHAVVAEAADGHRIRVALSSDRGAVTVTSAEPMLVTAPGVRRTFSGRVVVRRDGARIRVNGIRLASPIRVTGRSAIELDGASLRGALLISAHEKGLLVVNALDLEDYVKSVVPSEVPATWPLEALKSQAIVSRTYALYHREERGPQDFDVDATTQSQVYGGLGSEDPATSEAVDATAGLVVTYDGRLALTPYHSTSSGPTEDAAEVWGIDLPYLKGVECPFDASSPVFQWDRRLSFETIESALREAGYRVGPLATVTPLGRNRSGRVSAVRILHAEGEIILQGEALRRIIGYQRLPSMRFDVVDVDVDPRDHGFGVRFHGGGWGHGVGLCQWGMKALAERGWSADRIIDYYYPGTTLDHVASRPHRAP